MMLMILQAILVSVLCAGGVRDRQLQAEQAHDGAQQALGLAPGSADGQAQQQPGFHRHVGIGDRAERLGLVTPDGSGSRV